MLPSNYGVGVDRVEDEEIFSMADFRKTQRERLREEKWKYLEEKMKMERRNITVFGRSIILLETHLVTNNLL